MAKIQEIGAHACEGGAAETRAIHEVMELVRGNSELSHMVIRLRGTGMPWHEVKAAIDAEAKRQAPPPSTRKSAKRSGYTKSR